MNQNLRPKIGLALSGSGNRTAFYIGFLERLAEAKIPIDYIAAMSGGSLVAAAYACGSLEEFKKWGLGINKLEVKKYVTKSNDRGGLYSLALLEEQMRVFTKGLTFEEAKPQMAFVAVDIENGEQVILCMGDIARAATISCTLPGAFEPVKWGGRTLVDGGLLSQIPIDVLKNAGVDITIGVNMRGTKHIFTPGQINAKKIINFFKKYLFIDKATSWIHGLFDEDIEFDFSKKPGIFSVLGKSLDIAIKASQQVDSNKAEADLIITPAIYTLKRSEFDDKENVYFYEMGKKIAGENISKIEDLIKSKNAV